MIISRIICTLLPALAIFSCFPDAQGTVIPAPHPVVTPDKGSDKGDDKDKGEGQGQGQDQGGETNPPATALKFYSISCGPGEDASNSMTVSWAVDSTKIRSYVQYTKASDAGWKRASTVQPEQDYYCTVYDGIWSKSPEGDFYENARFIKYGTTLSGLEPDTDYKYVIRGEDGSVSREGHFRTAGAAKWSCCVISDFHTYTPLPNRLTSAMGMIDKVEKLDPSLDWVLSPGDVVVWGGSYSYWQKFFEEQNTADYMWARVNGNHDNWTREANEVTKQYDIPNDFFKGSSYYPQNGYGEEMGVCYHFRYGNTLFVMLNSEDMSSSNSEYSDAVEWTRTVVREARGGVNPPEFVVVLMHIEWFAGTDGSTEKYDSWHKVFDELGVNLAIAGDNHVYVRTHPIYDDKVVSDGKGTVYLQTPASDNDRGRDIKDGTPKNSDKIAFRWSEGSHSIGAIHMEMDGSTINLKLIDRNGNTIDSSQIKAR